MNRIKLWLSTTALLALSALPAVAGTAKLQVIHNAADPAAASVDIYVNGNLLLDDFTFRSATPFVEVPSDVDLAIGVAPGTSSSAADIIASFPVRFADRGAYIAIANGVLDPATFAANPDGLDIGFSIYPYEKARLRSPFGWLVSALAFHGASDAPGVDILAETRLGNLKIFDNLNYTDYSGYRYLLPKKYTLLVTPENDNRTVVASFEADLSGLRGGAAVVFASGFLDPAANQSGAPFGLFAAFPNGTVVEFPRLDVQPGTAKLQVIHNAADPAAASVDIYVNGNLLLNDFAFRAATPFVEVPAGVELAIGVAPGSSTSAADIIATFPVTLERDETYVAIAGGVLSPGAFTANPDGRSISFDIFPRGDMRTKGTLKWLVDVIAFHGATDAPEVDIIATGGWFRNRIINDLGFGDFSSYRWLLPTEYRLDVTPAADNQTIVASFTADLNGLGGGAAVVFASGFLDPAANQSGAPFGLFAALPNGTVVEFPAIVEEQFARLQVIHNAADPAAEMVDVYVNGNLLLDNFAFRTATPFVDVPANVNLAIGVAPSTSTSSADALATFDVTLAPNGTYIAVANGVLTPGAFAVNPDGRSTGFTLFVNALGRESGQNGSSNVDLAVLHGSTDAPTVDVVARSVATIVNDAAYGDFTDYLTVPAGAYTLDITPGNDNNVVVASFTADLSGLGGAAGVVFASGFLSSADNQSGEPFGLFAALPSGVVVPLPAATPPVAKTGGALPTEFTLAQNYPNPFNPSTTISFALPQPSDVRLSVYNVLGQEVMVLVDRAMEAGAHAIEFDASGMSSGVYFYRIEAESFGETKKMVLVK